MKENFSIEKPVLLIGEGNDENRFFSALVKHLGLVDTIQVAGYGGKEKLAGFLEIVKAQNAFPKLKALGITRDADDNYNAALQSVNSAIQNARFTDSLHTGKFILPKENTKGALEALVLEAAAESTAWPCVEAFMECIETKTIPAASLTAKDKRRLHVWLSTLSRPDLRLGEAAEKGKIPFDHPVFQPITGFIKSLVKATEK